MAELSLIIPTFNGKRFLREAVESALTRGPASLEILVVDDGSTDGGLDTIRDLPVRTLRNDQNRGIAAAYNLALKEARGEYVGFLDHDDISAPGALTTALDWLESHPDESVVRGTVAGAIDASGAPLGSFEEVFHAVPPLPEFLTFEDIKDSAFQSGIFFCALWLHVFRREIVRRVGSFDESLRVTHDVDYLLRVLKTTPIRLLPLPMAYYRLHGANTSGHLVDGHFRAHPRTLAEAILVGLSHGIRGYR